MDIAIKGPWKTQEVLLNELMKTMQNNKESLFEEVLDHSFQQKIWTSGKFPG